MKKKRVSKKNKISWRKHVNIDDVEDFLEDQRLEERLGLNLSTATNDQLFSLDTTAEPVQISKKEKSRKLIADPKCFQILKPHTKVPDPHVQRNRVRTKEERRNLLVKLKERDRRAKGILKAKEKDSIREKQLYEKKKLNRPKKNEVTEDVWEVKENNGIPKLNDWINDEAKVHNLRQTGTYLKNVVPNIQKKPSELPTVEPPHPGTSYNPSFEDHQSLLKEVAEKEQELIKRDKHLNRVTRSILRRVDANKDHKLWMKEMSQGLPNKNSHETKLEESDVTDDEYRSVNPPVKNRKKTLKQRRKQKEHLLREKMRLMAKIEKKKVSDLHKLRLLKQHVDKEENKIVVNKEKKKKLMEIKKKQPKRLGAKKFEEKDLEFSMPSDLPGNLRNIKKESSLLVDRFISMQKRSVIPPSTKVQAKKAKIKRFVKPGHKTDWKITVAGFNT